MSSFDTSGEVALGPSVHVPGFSHRNSIRWPDLDAFTQGYIEALLASQIMVPGPDGPEPLLHPGFSDLAPETLARIIADCADASHRRGTYGVRRGGGARFWTDRQSGGWKSFPPLTVTLGDDGKVYLTEVQS